MKRLLRGGTACKATRGDRGLEGVGRKTSYRDRRHGRTAKEDKKGNGARRRRHQQRAERLHCRLRGFARGCRQALRKASTLYDLPGRFRRDHACSADTGRLVGSRRGQQSVGPATVSRSAPTIAAVTRNVYSPHPSVRRNKMPNTVRLHRVLVPAVNSIPLAQSRESGDAPDLWWICSN
jgi:hypothetical protein